MQHWAVDPSQGLGRGDVPPAAEAVAFVERSFGLGLWRWCIRTGAMDWSDGLYGLLELRPANPPPSFCQLLAMMHPEDRMRHADMEAAAARGRPVERRFRVILPNGRLRLLTMKGEALFDPGGRPQRVLGFLRETAAPPCAPQQPQADSRRDGSPAAITGAQVRAARAIVNWSVRELAAASDVSVSSIRRIEEFDGTVRTTGAHPERIRAALEKAGAEFSFPAVGKPGVRPR